MGIAIGDKKFMEIAGFNTGTLVVYWNVWRIKYPITSRLAFGHLWFVRTGIM